MKITAVGVIGIPICTIAAFLGLLLAGRTINVISLAGIAFANVSRGLFGVEWKASRWKDAKGSIAFARQ